MSLLMDALKKADEAAAVDTPSTIPDEKTNDWNDELLPQFQINSQIDTDSKPADDAPTSEEWGDEFLPQFQNEQTKNPEIENVQNNIIKNNEENINSIETNELSPEQTETKLTYEENVVDDIEPVELIEPPAQTEIKLSDTNKLKDKDIGEIQNLFSLTEHHNETEDSQIPILDIHEQSPLETPTEPPKEEYQPQDAQRIFTATKNPPSSSSKRTIWLISILGIILIGMGAGYFYLQPSSNQQSTLKLGQLSKQPKFNQTPIEQAIPVKQPQTYESVEIVDDKPVQPTPIKIPKIKPVIKTVKPIPIQIPQTISTNKINQEKTGIRTLRKKKVNSVSKDLSKAYTALQSGNNKTARRKYQQVLRHDKTNRDALLGMAALAIRNNNIPQAQQFYQLVLRKYPKDVHAQIGLINSFGNAPKNETQLKLLLRQSPKAAYIHFSLGNLYANQERWELAQQAYFDAMRYNKKHADYAYNLAISLDRINQPKAALTYYKRALNLMNNQAIRFNPKTLQKRIDTLTKVLK
ncbi:tetratricopeptide repeat protein [Candidatus Halobeggiatoa sp. HSG11]|nr:tetratricopeptide repeat protein [Candidatus Halobeggiatoa sp. HSG11]